MSWVAAAIVGSAVVGGVMSNEAAGSASRASDRASQASIAEQRRQFDLQREDSAPYREAGANALNTLEGSLQSGDYDPSRFSYDGSQPDGEPLPEFGGGDRFNFDLEGDQGYQFARDEAIKAANRQGAGSGQYGSGARLAEISDRVTGVASQYANDAYNRQMGTSRENYGRDVSEYSLDYGRQQDIYGRESDREATEYSRNMTEYGLDYQREQDVYGQNQNYLNRLSSMAGVGQTANAQSAASGSNMANAISNINASNAVSQGNAANNRFSGINNAVQSGVGNYMLYNSLQTPNVAGDAYQPANSYYTR